MVVVILIVVKLLRGTVQWKCLFGLVQLKKINFLKNSNNASL